MALVKPHYRYGRETLADINWCSGPDRKLCHNTYRETDSEGRPCVRFHSTIIITQISLNAYRLNSGGWQTSTTKQRLNALLHGTGISITQTNFVWWVTDLSHGPVTREFYDGIEVIA